MERSESLSRNGLAMISEPTVFSFGCKTTVLADELYVLSETKKIWCFVAI